MIRKSSFLILAAALALPLSASAATVQWSGWQSAYSDSDCYLDAGGCHLAQQTIQYSADAINASTGASVCNSSVPAGTSVQFNFAPHTPSDFSWFYTGESNDSPYGTWLALPPLTIPASGTIQAWDADPGNYLVFNSGTGQPAFSYRDDMSGWQAGFVSPPAQSVAGLSGVFDCGTPSSTGSVTCTAAHPGNATVLFNFAQTNGRYAAQSIAPYMAMDANGNQLSLILSPPDFFANLSTYYQYYVNWMNWYHAGWPQYAAYSPTLSLNDYHLQYVRLPFSVPAQNISCPITVTTPANRPPSKPTVETAAQCTVGQDFSIGMTGTDPDGDRLYYQVYWLWDTDKAAYERIPASGTVPSGQLVAATHLYATSGSHAVAVKAVDTAGNVSPASQQISFSCALPPTPPPTATLSQSAAITGVGEPFTVSWGSTNATSCTVQKRTPSGTVTNPWATGLSGSQVTAPTQTGTHNWWIDCTGEGGTAHQELDHLVSCTPSTTYTCDGSSTIVSTTVTAQCTTSVTRTTCAPNPPYFCSAGSSSCLTVGPSFGPNGELRVSPSLVPSGAFTRVFWNVSNVSTCTVTGDNPLQDTWTVVGNVVNNWISTAGAEGMTSSPIVARTTFSLSCIGLDSSTISDTAVVNILPVFEEQ